MEVPLKFNFFNLRKHFCNVVTAITEPYPPTGCSATKRSPYITHDIGVFVTIAVVKLALYNRS